MDNSKKTIHSSGPLGLLVRSGQIKRIDNEDLSGQTKRLPEYSNNLGPYFKTSTGLTFNENELINVDPKQCEPWRYANRLEGDMGDMSALIKSIKENGQLQPGLIRQHPKPYNNIKYEVIFGRRRYEACVQLNIPFLAVRKNVSNIEEALIFQETENRARKDISNYSNSILYKKLLEDKIFKNEKDISEKLGISLSKVYDIMAYSKIPADLVKLIPDIHNLSNSLALKIVSIIKDSPQLYLSLLKVAAQIGSIITSPAKLEASLIVSRENKKENYTAEVKRYKSSLGKKLFTFKFNHRGAPCIMVDKTNKYIDYEDLCQCLVAYLENIQQAKDA